MVINIETVFSAFQKFNAASNRIRLDSMRDPAKWEWGMAEARDELKKELGDLAEHIDWSEK